MDLHRGQPRQDAATAGELVGQFVGQCDGTAVADANARELVQQVDGLRRRGQHPEHGVLQHRTKEPHELRREAILNGRRSDVKAQLCSGGLEIGGLGVRFSEQSQDEHPQQADGGELSTPLDNTCRPPKFLASGPRTFCIVAATLPTISIGESFFQHETHCNT